MTISRNQFLAVLAMDAYKRDGVGLEFTGGVIGTATIIPRADLGINENEYQSWQRSGFYSIAYDIGGGVEGLPQTTYPLASAPSDLAQLHAT